jgi:hypothetical protein
MKEQGVKKPLPEDGVNIAASPGNKFTRINLDLADDGITLAMVGAASALKGGNRHSLTLKQGREGIVLSAVGAATAATR